MVAKVVSGHTKSCGRCNLITIKDGQRFGRLKTVGDHDVKKSSMRPLTWLCECGLMVEKPAYSVLSGNTKSCGRCNLIPASAVPKYGRLKMSIPKDLRPGSNKEVEWICDCGKLTLKKVSHVTSGRTSSCGRCRDGVHDWYVKNIDWIRTVRYPITPESIPKGGIRALEVITKSSHKFRAICPACSMEWTPTWGHIKFGDSLTCGCVSNKISLACKEIGAELERMGHAVEYEYDVGGMKYDVFVRDTRVLLEYNGERWHSSPEARARDLRKIENAIRNGYDPFTVSERDLVEKKGEVLSSLSRLFAL